MAESSEERRLMTAYLLGTLPEQERAQIGERALTDSAFFDRLREVEDDLVDELARGELNAQSAARIERFLAETNQLDRLDIARALHAVGGEAKSPGSTWRTLGLLAASLVLVAGAAWFTLRQTGTRPAPAAIARPDAVLSVFLPAGVLRGQQRVERVTIPRGTSVVRIGLEASPAPEMMFWRVELRTPGGNAPLYAQSAAFRAGPVELIVPARLLTAGRYEAGLSTSRDGTSWETAGYYYFTVP